MMRHIFEQAHREYYNHSNKHHADNVWLSSAFSEDALQAVHEAHPCPLTTHDPRQRTSRGKKLCVMTVAQIALLTQLLRNIRYELLAALQEHEEVFHGYPFYMLEPVLDSCEVMLDHVDTIDDDESVHLPPPLQL
jgi:hypothetical protein